MKFIIIISIALSIPIIGLSIPVSFTLSNTQSYIGISATPLNVEIGYPYSSISFENFAGINLCESTTTYVDPYILIDVYRYKNLNFFAGADSEFGTLPEAFSTDKIIEVGRNFFDLEVDLKMDAFFSSIEYSRFYSDFNYNRIQNVLFLAPANYSGEMPNTLSFFASYAFDWFKSSNVILEGFTKIDLPFSDALVISSPIVEIGISLITDTKNFM